MHFTEKDFQSMDAEYRRTFLNSVSGLKNVVLVGTLSRENVPNLAVFNTCIHLGADPFLIGILMRPQPENRHTYPNIKRTGHFTVNSVGAHFFEKAHRTSARFPLNISEFEATGLTPFNSDILNAPYVAESALQLGLSYEEEHLIHANGTTLVVGRVRELFLNNVTPDSDGYVDPSPADICVVNGTDAYYKTIRISRLPYAKP
jgi:flavin reductase (DIM6/NTAB) family NADH-FMN oxidoreductase RutF